MRGAQLVLKDALMLISYIDAVPIVVNFCAQYNICINSADELKRQCDDLNQNSIPLKKCPQRVNEFEKDFGGMTPEELLFFDKLSDVQDVLDWYKQFSDAEFNEKEAFVRATTQE